MVLINPIGFLLLEKGKADQEAARLERQELLSARGVGPDQGLDGGEILVDAARAKAAEKMAKQSQLNTAKLAWNVLSTPVVFVTFCAAVYNVSLAKLFRASYGEVNQSFLLSYQ